MKMKIYIQLIQCALVCFSTQLSAQNSFNETDLTGEIAAHQSKPLPQTFGIQQAITKSKISLVKLSPDGNHLFYMTNESNGVSLHLFTVETETSKTLFQSKILKQVHWSMDGKILFLQGADYMAYINPFDDKAKAQIFYRFDNKNEETFLGLDSSQAQQILIRRKINSKDDNKPHQIVRLNKMGEETILFADKFKVYDFLINDTGQLSFVRQPGTDKHIIYQLNGEQKKPVYSCIVIDKCQMVKFNQETQELFMAGFGDYKFRSYYSVNIETMATNLIHQDPKGLSDSSPVKIDETTGQLLQLYYLSDRMYHYALDENLNNHYRWLESNLAGNLGISARSSSNNWLVVQTHAQLHHRKYFIYNLTSQTLKPILQKIRLEGKPIDSEQLVKNIPISYLASDGMLLHGYLMLPSGRKLSEVPLLTSIHGGPFNRNKGGYNPIQYMVNQGYAIFQPNFRASTGYGLDYMLAGKEKFSTRVQQDILDGIDFILNQGIGDKSNMGVFGHSFGGYSVLSLMSQYPNVFQAGVATAPGTNLLKLLKTMDEKRINEYDGLSLKMALTVLFADLNDKETINKMEKTSPATTWAGINKPLLMWGGRLDKRIPITHLRDYALKLKQAGKTIEFFEDKKVGHNPSSDDVQTRLAMLYMITEFFNRHIKNTTTESNDDIDRYMQRYRVY